MFKVGYEGPTFTPTPYVLEQDTEVQLLPSECGEYTIITCGPHSFKELNNQKVGGIPIALFNLGYDSHDVGYLRTTSGHVFFFSAKPCEISIEDNDNPYFRFQSTLTPSGILSFDIYTKKEGIYHPDLYASELLFLSIERFKHQGFEIKMLECLWSEGDQYDMYWETKTNCLDSEKAARSTKSAIIAQNLGFPNVIVDECKGEYGAVKALFY